MKNATTPRNPRKQRGISLLNVVLGLGVAAAITVFTINQFTETGDAAANNAALNEILAAITKAETYSLLTARRNHARPSTASIWGTRATNAYGAQYDQPSVGSGAASDITMTYKVRRPTAARANASCVWLRERMVRASINALRANATGGCSAGGPGPQTATLTVIVD